MKNDVKKRNDVKNDVILVVRYPNQKIWTFSYQNRCLVNAYHLIQMILTLSSFLV